MPAVFTIVRRSDNSPLYPGQVLFRPVEATVAASGSVITGNDVIAATDGSGFFTLTLLPGDYYVWVGPVARRRRITVPDVDQSQLLEDLLGITGGMVPLNYRNLGDNLQLINGTEGGWHSIAVSGPLDGLQLTIGPAGTAFAFPSVNWPASDELQFWNPDLSAWFSPYLEGTADAPQLSIGTAGDAFSNARKNGGKLQLKNLTTGGWHTIYLQFDPPTLAIGPSDT